MSDNTQLPLDQLRQIRIDKIAKLRELGLNAYPQPKIKRNNIEDVLKMEFEKPVTVVGRIVAKRGHGKLMFLDIKDFSGKIQLVIKADIANENSLKVSELLDIGDFVLVEGQTYNTQAGQFSVLVINLQLISKAIRPLPNKLDGFVDKEEKYRQRYADMILDEKTFTTLVDRSKIVQLFRTFFLQAGFFEVNTPTLQEMYGGASARPFTTHHNALDTNFYLRISPELYLKRLIVGGFEKVFEFTINFRNEGMGRWHNPEFQNIEFYWAYSTYEELMDFTEEMFRFVVKNLKGDYKLKYGDEIIDFEPKFERLTFRDALIKHTGIDFEQVDGEENLRNLIKEKGLLKGEDLNTKGFSNLLDILYKRTTRPHLRGPLFLTDYPAEMIALAKKKEQDPKKIATFQLVILGEEFVKAYNELNDPIDQKQRWEETEKIALEGQDEAERLDEDFVRALEYGMPPTAGWGLGFERTVALLTDNHSVKDVMFFPTLRPEIKSEVKKENGQK